VDYICDNGCLGLIMADDAGLGKVNPSGNYYGGPEKSWHLSRGVLVTKPSSFTTGGMLVEKEARALTVEGDTTNLSPAAVIIGVRNRFLQRDPNPMDKDNA